MKVVEVPMSQMFLLPPKAHLCQECAVEHDPAFPHNPQTLYYQTKFKMQHGRHGTWADAMAHCSDVMKADWKRILLEKGVDVEVES